MKITYETIVDVIRRKVTTAANEGGRLIKEVILSDEEWRELSKEVSVTPKEMRTVLKVATPYESQLAALYGRASASIAPPTIHEVLIKREVRTSRDF